MYHSEIINSLSTVDDCLIINGYFSDSLTVPIISYMTDSQIENKKSGKKLSFLVAESFQNVVRHGYDEKEENNANKLKEGFFAMLKVQSKIIIASTNSIENKRVPKLSEDLNKLSLLDKDSLKAEFIDVLNQGKTTEGGGAGLGLIEIMRKTGSQFDYSFSDKSANVSLINFDIYFNEDKLAEGKIERFDTSSLRNLILGDNILFLRKGLFNHDTFLQLSSLLDKKSEGQSHANDKTIFYIFVELIQNMYKHGLSDEEGYVPGMFYLQRSKSQISLTSQNLSSNEDALKTKNRVEKINSLSTEELLNLYKEKLMQNTFMDENKSADIGLIEMAKESKNPIFCSISKVSDNSSNLTITVKLNL